jgi:hypothetical protein
VFIVFMFCTDIDVFWSTLPLDVSARRMRAYATCRETKKNRKLCYAIARRTRAGLERARDCVRRERAHTQKFALHAITRHPFRSDSLVTSRRPIRSSKTERESGLDCHLRALRPFSWPSV